MYYELTITHNHGADYTTHLNETQAKQCLFRYVEKNWEREEEMPVHLDEAIEAYFEEADGYYSIGPAETDLPSSELVRFAFSFLRSNLNDEVEELLSEAAPNDTLRGDFEKTLTFFIDHLEGELSSEPPKGHDERMLLGSIVHEGCSLYEENGRVLLNDCHGNLIEDVTGLVPSEYEYRAD